MGPRLAFSLDVPATLHAVSVPPMLLVPLAENAIKHGLNPLTQGGSIRISASDENGRLVVSVADTGQGFVRNAGGGTGLANLRARLAGLYGTEAALSMAHNAPQGVIATVVRFHVGRCRCASRRRMSVAIAPARPIAALTRTVGGVVDAWRAITFEQIGLATLLGLAAFGQVLVRALNQPYPAILVEAVNAQLGAFALLLAVVVADRAVDRGASRAFAYGMAVLVGTALGMAAMTMHMHLCLGCDQQSQPPTGEIDRREPVVRSHALHRFRVGMADGRRARRLRLCGSARGSQDYRAAARSRTAAQRAGQARARGPAASDAGPDRAAIPVQHAGTGQAALRAGSGGWPTRAR